jgi:endonuclease I
MLTSRRILAALLLAAVPLNAQVTRLAPSRAPLPTAPGSFLAAPVFAAPSLSAPSLNAFPLSAPALTAAPVSLLPDAPLAAAPALAAAAPLAAPAEGFRRKGPAIPRAAAADASILTSGARLFDGSSDLVTRSGSVFALSRAPQPGILGAVSFIRVRPAPAAAARSVPDTQDLHGPSLLGRVARSASKGQIDHSYHEASSFLFSVADNHTLNGISGVADAYSGVFIPGTSPDGHDYSETGDKSHDGWSRPQAMNVEHGFPQTFFEKGYPMRSDLHIMMATFEHPNGVRGILPFGAAKNAHFYRNDAGAKSDGRVFEPPDFTKGRAARLMLYFYARYRDEAFMKTPRAAAFWNRQIDVLLDWNRRFPPTVEERRRNDQVETFQGNRNPFVDDHGLADRIGADALRSGFAAQPSVKALAVLKADDRRSDKPRKGRKRSAYNRPQRNRRGSRR